MIHIAITVGAVEAIAATVKLGSVAFEAEPDAEDECRVWLEAACRKM